MEQFSLIGKTALITGASRGIGEAIAIYLAKQGALCILVSRKVEDLSNVEKKITDNGGKAASLPCNVGKMEEISGLMQKVEELYGKLDILINNAAANPYFGEMINAEEWAWDKTCDVNLKGPFFMIQAAAKLMQKGGGGSIVNVSSVNGMKPSLFQGIYSITKAGLITMTRAWAIELAKFNIRVNALLPGLTDTKFASAITQNEDIKNMILPQIPMGRIAQPEEMAGAVLFLVSDASSYTTGSCLTCDGGMLA
ncbi:FabG1 [Desulfamplus magnetovallimortis]|uniref:FabG1 n=1 Tax=Desulfamplus magnetovallimortis TaxID=1246637 RepID=A0A1W1H7J3_9BACT|nr:SDR family oxidoreductase [Desulfamplus magnetovallimortis]SLM28404.1 FabG1 [Desulfamplus magnetovallimortis]